MDIQIIKREMERVPWQHLPLHRLSEKTQRALHTNAACLLYTSDAADD